MSLRDAQQLHERAVLVHEQHAEHAKELGYLEMARLAEERAERARGRAQQCAADRGAPAARSLPG